MPWINQKKGDKSYYRPPTMCPIDEHNNIEKALNARAYYARSAQDLKELQKKLGQQKHYEEARFLKEEVSENLSWQMAWDFTVKYIEGKEGYCCYPYSFASKDLSSKIDACFYRLI